MIYTLLILLIFQALGEGCAYFFQWPVPGPVLGMLFLFVAMLFRKELAQQLTPTVHEFLKHLSLLFIPASVGIMLHGQRLFAEFLPISAALIVSSIASIVVTALVLKWLMK